MSSTLEVNSGAVGVLPETRQASQVQCDVAVIGAGPYGLSAGSHLKSKGVRVRVFGEPMEFWAKKMPEGMLLRSPRAASNLSDAKDAFTLDAFENAFYRHGSTERSQPQLRIAVARG